MWTIIARWFTQECRPTARKSRATVQLTVESLEGRNLPSVTAVLASLRDPSLWVTATANYRNDHALTRPDMIAIFRQAAKDGNVTTVELNDLKTIVNHGAELGMPFDVRALSTNIVSRDIANQSFQSAPLAPTGQLAVGHTGKELNKLVDKWLFGADLPQARNDYGLVYRYQVAAGTLFGGGGPSTLDVKQGYLGDCYLLASLGATAAKSPQTIRDMFRDNGDGTFTVRFYHQIGAAQTAAYVTVSRQLPTDGYGRFIFANMGQSMTSSTTVLWVALAEKAYAQLAEQGWSRVGYAAAANSYAAIIGGNGYQPLQQIMGAQTIWQWVNPATINSLMVSVTRGDLVTIGSRLNPSTDSRVIACHEYYITGYDAKSRTFTIVNPWGAQLQGVGTLHLTAKEILSCFAVFDVAASR